VLGGAKKSITMALKKCAAGIFLKVNFSRRVRWLLKYEAGGKSGEKGGGSKHLGITSILTKSKTKRKARPAKRTD